MSLYKNCGWWKNFDCIFEFSVKSYVRNTKTLSCAQIVFPSVFRRYGDVGSGEEGQQPKSLVPTSWRTHYLHYKDSSFTLKEIIDAQKRKPKPLVTEGTTSGTKRPNNFTQLLTSDCVRCVPYRANLVDLNCRTPDSLTSHTHVHIIRRTNEWAIRHLANRSHSSVSGDVRVGTWQLCNSTFSRCTDRHVV